jgi:hypothetical protein
MSVSAPGDPDFLWHLYHRLRDGFSPFKDKTLGILTYCYYSDLSFRGCNVS